MLALVFNITNAVGFTYAYVRPSHSTSPPMPWSHPSIHLLHMDTPPPKHINHSPSINSPNNPMKPFVSYLPPPSAHSLNHILPVSLLNYSLICLFLTQGSRCETKMGEQPCWVRMGRSWWTGSCRRSEEECWESIPVEYKQTSRSALSCFLSDILLSRVLSLFGLNCLLSTLPLPSILIFLLFIVFTWFMWDEVISQTQIGWRCITVLFWVGSESLQGYEGSAPEKKKRRHMNDNGMMAKKRGGRWRKGK